MNTPREATLRLKPCALALAAAILWGLGCGVLGVITIYTETYGHRIVELLGNVSWGYKPASWLGALIGLLWAFLDGFVGTLILVWLYNGFTRLCGPTCCAKPSPGDPTAV